MLKPFYVILVLCTTFINAQSPALIHLTEKDDLPDVEFFNIIEDSNRFIWLAADNGLYRYNGYEYKYFSNPVQRGNAVFGTVEDDKGLIWCNNISGQFFYVKEEQLHLFIDLGKKLNGELSDFFITDNHLVVITRRNIYKISLKDKKIATVYDIKQNNSESLGYPQKSDSYFYYTKGDNIIKSNLDIKEEDTLDLQIYKKNQIFSNISRVKTLINDSLHLVHFSNKGNNIILKFDIEEKKYWDIKVPEILKDKTINYISFIKNEIWFSTNSGIIVCQLIKENLEVSKRFLNSVYVTKVIYDSNQNFWITSKGQGVFVIPNIHITKYELPEQLSDLKIVKKISNSGLLLGSKGGVIASFDIETQITSIVDSSSVSTVRDILVDKYQKNSLIITDNKAFNYDFSSNKKQFINKSILRGAKKISAIDNDQLVVSLFNRAVVVDKHFEEKDILVNKRSYSNYYSRGTKNLYVSSVNGLFHFDNNFTRSEVRHNQHSIFANSIVETIDNTIWVSTFKNGIFGIRNDRVVEVYNKENGLLSNKIRCLKSDGNLLWIATEKGMQVFDTGNGNFNNLTKEDGIPTYRVSDIEVLSDKVLFTTNLGLYSFERLSSFKKSNKKRLYFTEITINDSIRTIKEYYDLNYKENKIVISFNTNGFQSKMNTRYAYRLIGLDTIWRNTKEYANSVSYNSLPSGNYVFQIKADSGSSNVKSINFFIAKPFWKKWWFYLIMGLFMISIFYLVLIMQTKKIENKQMALLKEEVIRKRLVMSQLENLRSQMNPHFIFNALNSIQEYIMLNEKELASSFLVKFSRLIRMYLDHSKENEINLSEEIKTLELYLELEKNRFENILEYEIRVSEKTRNSYIKVPPLFIQPYVENALKHGLLHKKENRRLKIDFKLNSNNDILICIIEDNGIGIEASKIINHKRYKTHKSFATDANQKRIDLLNSDRLHKISIETINLENFGKQGTKVVLTIPLEKNQI